MFNLSLTCTVYVSYNTGTRDVSRLRAEVNKCHASRVHVITILYPEDTATVATALRCLTTHASYFVIAISYKIRQLR